MMAGYARRIWNAGNTAGTDERSERPDGIVHAALSSEKERILFLSRNLLKETEELDILIT
mgnify:CR=1 FL=1|jgi:hypothetical protein